MTPKQQYDARQELKRIARGGDPDAKTDEQLQIDMIHNWVERLVAAFEGIEMNTRKQP